jgi:serine/threonine-protein kinase
VPVVGELLGGKYRLIAKLGEGGMGAVFQAENMVTGKQVAVKWLHARAAGKDGSSRLLREARAASRLRHPNVVDVYDVLQDGESLFLIMELLDGETVGAYLARDSRPKLSEFIALMLPALEGVAAAHDKGVIHRDLKPENIFLVRSPGAGVVAKVVDFGVAKVMQSNGALTLTDTGAAVGTPLYMSIEQLNGDKDVDGRTDVYAFGAMLYDVITGQLPYTGTTLPELALKLATTDAVPVKVLRPDVPTALARLVDWSIARQREQRLPDVPTFIRELTPFARDSSFRTDMTDDGAPLPRAAARCASIASGRTASHAEQDPAPQLALDVDRAARAHGAASGHVAADTLVARELTSEPRTRRRWLPIGAGTAVLVALAGCGLAWWLALPESPAASAADSGGLGTRPVSASVSAPAPYTAVSVDVAHAPEPAAAQSSTDGDRESGPSSATEAETPRFEHALPVPALTSTDGTPAKPPVVSNGVKPRARSTPKRIAPSLPESPAAPQAPPAARKSAIEVLAF